MYGFEKKTIYRIFENEFMQFGDSISPKNNWRGNITIFGGMYYSEINEYYTELGALAQERNPENGNVGSEYTIFFKKASFDGRYSLWHVFGSVYANTDLLKYISYTAGENNGIPRRNVTISNCKIL